MKKLITLCTAVLLTASVFAQAPQKMSYQAVIRNSSNALVGNTQIGMQISILQGSASGTAVYVETQTPTTNANGLASVEIGGGTVVSGDFSNIDWTNGPYFIKTETDPSGGTSYTITGTSQLLSVPYALHSNIADSVKGGVSITETDPVYNSSVASGITSSDTSNWNNNLSSESDPVFSASVAKKISATDTVKWNKKQDKITATKVNQMLLWNGSKWDTIAPPTSANQVLTYSSGKIQWKPAPVADHYVGEHYGGGVIFYVDSTHKHGLIVDLNYLSTSHKWADQGTTGATSNTNGQANTDSIMASPYASGSAAELCVNSTAQGYSDWFLPAKNQLQKLYDNLTTVNATLSGISGASQIFTSGRKANCWSSTEFDAITARFFSFDYPNFDYLKDNTYSVRGVRAF